MEFKIDGGHLLQLVGLLVSAFRSAEAKRRTWKKEVFEREVVAIHGNMALVHTNYLTIFAELEERVLQGKSSGLGIWIAKVRAEHAFLRESLRAMDLPTPAFTDSQWITAAHNYGEAVRDYFTLPFDQLDPDTAVTKHELRVVNEARESTGLSAFVQIATSLENADDPLAAREQFVGRIRRTSQHLDRKLRNLHRAFAILRLRTFSE